MAVKEAGKLGLTRPKDPEAEWTFREVDLNKGRRHLVVFSAFKAQHDRIVRQLRLKRREPICAASAVMPSAKSSSAQR